MGMTPVNHPGAKPITRDQCYAWIQDKTFRLQETSYQDKHPDWPGAVGLEIEMLPLFIESESQKPRIVPLQGEQSSLAAWLRVLAKEHNWRLSETDHHGESLLVNVFLDERDNLSFEPGGQLEFSSRPYECLSQALSRTIEIQKILDEYLKKHGVTLMQVGFNPWHLVDEIGLQMPKPRYDAMNRFFGSISPYGPRMMRQTCTVQVNLDFGRSEAMMAKRYLASMLLAPFSGAIFNDSAIEGMKPLGMTGFRSKIWRHMDPTRTGVPPLGALTSSLTKSACVDHYFNFLMAAKVVFVTGLDYKVMTSGVTWADWLKCPIEGLVPTTDDFETHMSLLFPEVRARGFLELRSVDCQARMWQFVPAAWWTGLLYDNQALDKVIEMLLPLESRLTELLDNACFGLQHPILAEYAKKLITLASEGLSRLPGCYFGEGALQTLHIFAEQFTLRGRVPAQDLLDEYERQGSLDYTTFLNVERAWRDLLDKRSAQ